MAQADLFKRHRPLDERVRLFKDLRGRHWGDEKLGLTALKLHDLPHFGEAEGRLGMWRVDGEGLGLVEDNHGCCAVSVGL